MQRRNVLAFLLAGGVAMAAGCGSGGDERFPMIWKERFRIRGARLARGAGGSKKCDERAWRED